MQHTHDVIPGGHAIGPVTSTPKIGVGAFRAALALVVETTN
jgi:hypothetical protein